MANTTANDVIQSFESSFVDRHVIPEELENVWLLKAIGRYSAELETLYYDENLKEFDRKLDRYIIDSLAAIMNFLYQQRQLSLVNKREAIVSKDLSIDGSGHTKVAARHEYDYSAEEMRDMIENQKPSAYGN